MTQEQICYELDEALDCEERFTLYEPNQKEYCEKCGSSIIWDWQGNLYHCLDSDCEFVGVEPIMEY